MREVIISRLVWNRIAELKNYLLLELQLSEEAAIRRMDRIGHKLSSLADPFDYALCRFRPWRKLGYNCVSFEGWVFAYEIVPRGIIIRDMRHSKLITDIVD